MRANSDVIDAACADHAESNDACEISAVRSLHSFTRGADEVRIGSWVQCASQKSAESHIMCVSELCQVFTHDACYIRMIGSKCVSACFDGDSLWMTADEHELTADARMLVNAEDVSISVLHAVRNGAQYRFRHVW